MNPRRKLLELWSNPRRNLISGRMSVTKTGLNLEEPRSNPNKLTLSVKPLTDTDPCRPGTLHDSCHKPSQTNSNLGLKLLWQTLCFSVVIMFWLISLFEALPFHSTLILSKKCKVSHFYPKHHSTTLQFSESSPKSHQSFCFYFSTLSLPWWFLRSFCVTGCPSQQNIFSHLI